MNTRQILLSEQHNFADFDDYLKQMNIHSLFIVCGNSIKNFSIDSHLADLCLNNHLKIVKFSDFSPNPKYEDIIKGISLFKVSECDAIMAVGGGSAIDVAKCIKAFYKAPLEKLPDVKCVQEGNKTAIICRTDSSDAVTYESGSNKHANVDFNSLIIANELPFIAMPTTAGSGSEGTHFAVMYFRQKKYSIANGTLVPHAVLFCPSVLASLPLKQKISTFLDAMTHSIEAYWSVNATPESRAYSTEAITTLLKYRKAYLASETSSRNSQEYNNDDILGNSSEENCYSEMLRAAYTAGKAINISKTTAGHAMSYKLTSTFGIPHGLAVAMCLKYVWKETIEKALKSDNTDLIETLTSLSSIFTGEINNTNDSNITSGLSVFNQILNNLVTDKFKKNNSYSIEELTASVNVERLKNHPVSFTTEEIFKIYENIIKDFYES